MDTETQKKEKREKDTESLRPIPATGVETGDEEEEPGGNGRTLALVEFPFWFSVDLNGGSSVEGRDPSSSSSTDRCSFPSLD